MYLAGIPQMTPELAWMFSIFLAPCKAKAQFGQLPPPRAARTVVEGLIWPFSLAFGRTPPSVALERMTTGRLFVADGEELFGFGYLISGYFTRAINSTGSKPRRKAYGQS